MSNEELIEIGNGLAMLWGGSCYEYEIDTQEKEVTFHCIEHGEKFGVLKTFEELLTEYDFDVSNIKNE